MKDVSLYESFLAELRKKIPQGAKLTNTLVDMLYIEREAVYRRLRGGDGHVQEPSVPIEIGGVREPA